MLIYRIVSYHMSAFLSQLAIPRFPTVAELLLFNQPGFYHALLWFLPCSAMVFTMQCYVMVLCLSVRPSQAGILSKWLNVSSHYQCHRLA